MTKRVDLREQESHVEQDSENVTGITEIICGIILREFRYQHQQQVCEELSEQVEEQYNDNRVGLCAVLNRRAGSLDTRPEGRDTEVC